MSARVSLIAAVASNGAIGKDGALPWRLPEDLRRFKETTLGHAVVMGRKTFESIGKPLPGRRNIVVSRQPDYSSPGIEVATGVEEALRLVSDDTEVFVIGGSEIYRQTLAFADRLHLTLVHHPVEGDAFFPEWSPAGFREISREERAEPFPFSFLLLERVAGSFRGEA